jgi:nicotinate-nucleotide adenylyltransferase
MRVGVFGGTFDPIHHGHLVLAEQCREQGQLDQVWFVPAFRPPNKLAHPITRFDQRVEMLQLAIAGNPRFRVDPLEQDRQGPSYTADTLALLQQRHPGDELWLLVGSDTLADIPNWYHPERVLDLAGLMVRARPGTKVMSVDELRTRLPLAPNSNIRLDVIQSPLIEISSRDLRQRASEGRTLRYFLPRAVEVYIQEKRLYQVPEGGGK